MPISGIFPEIFSSSLRPHNAGLTPNQKSMVMASTGGDPSLEVMNRHMRRILQPCDMGMKQDALLAEGDLLKAYQTLSRPDVNDDLNEKEGQAVPKKKRKKRKKEKIIPPPCSLG